MDDDTLSARVIMTHNEIEHGIGFACGIHVMIPSMREWLHRWEIWTFDMFHVFLDGNIWFS